MNKDIFIERYKRFGISDQEIAIHLQTVLDFENYVDKDIDDTNEEDIKKYFHYLIETNKNKYENVIHFARYYYYIGKQNEYIHMTKYFNSIGVLENIVERITLYDTKETQEKIIKEITLPPFGTDSKELPKYTAEFIKKLEKYIPRVSCNKILAGNNHQIPATSFDKEKEYYENAVSFEQYLKERHKRKVEELQYHYDNNLIWFEQVISKEAVEYVASNQEILSGVIDNDKLYITKIPYDIDNFLREDDTLMKRYYACHCSFVRENILKQTDNIPKEWCYCSGGFAKYPFEVVLNQELNITLLETPINGDLVCRFEVDLKNINYKK